MEWSCSRRVRAEESRYRGGGIPDTQQEKKKPYNSQNKSKSLFRIQCSISFRLSYVFGHTRESKPNWLNCQESVAGLKVSKNRVRTIAPANAILSKGFTGVIFWWQHHGRATGRQCSGPGVPIPKTGQNLHRAPSVASFRSKTAILGIFGVSEAQKGHF